MSLTAVIAIYLIFVGSLIAAVIILRQQNFMKLWVGLRASENDSDRKLADMIEKRHMRYFLGLTPKQLRFFWFGLALVLGGNGLLLVDATLAYAATFQT